MRRGDQLKISLIRFERQSKAWPARDKIDPTRRLPLVWFKIPRHERNVVQSLTGRSLSDTRCGNADRRSDEVVE